MLAERWRILCQRSQNASIHFRDIGTHVWDIPIAPKVLLSEWADERGSFCSIVFPLGLWATGSAVSPSERGGVGRGAEVREDRVPGFCPLSG